MTNSDEAAPPAHRAPVRDRAARPRPIVDGRIHDARWLEALRSAPDAAAEVQSAVVGALEARRHAHNGALRACFAGERVEGDVTLRFTVPVSSTVERLHVSSPTFVEVADGPPVGASTIACLESQLAGDDAIAAADESPFLARYDGPVEYGLRFWFPLIDGDVAVSRDGE